MDVERQMELVAKSPTEETVTLEELRHLFEVNLHPKHYIGLEISGPLHLGSLVITGFKINDFLAAGVQCKVFLADWHSFINNKLGGDWSKIRRAASYYKEAFRLFCPGVEVILGSDLYRGNDEYWENLVRFSKQITLARDTRCLTILGRSEGQKLDFAQYLYPPMQAVDIRSMDLDLVHAGIDQRKVHMLVREVFPKLGWKVPVAVHHHLLPGLGVPQRLGLDEDEYADLKISSKMSKSKPWTCIFIHDDDNEVALKIRRAWCPEGVVEDNPMLDFAKHFCFRDGYLTIDRDNKYGGSITYDSYVQLEAEYATRKLHPVDLKVAVASSVNKLIRPLRDRLGKSERVLATFEGEE